MDYKEIFLQTYESTFQLKEKWVREQLIKYREEERTYFSAEQKITKILKEEFWAFGPNDQPNFYYEVDETYNKLIEFHKENGISKVLRNEIKDLYQGNDKLNFGSYETFIESFATYKAIFDTYIFYGRISRLVKTYYELDELFRLKLESINDYKEYSDYDRLVKGKFPNYKKSIRDKVRVDHLGQFIPPENIAKNSKPEEPSKINTSLNLLSEEKFLLLDLMYTLIAESSEKKKKEEKSSKVEAKGASDMIKSIASDMKKAEFARLMLLTRDALDPILLELPSNQFSRNVSYNNFNDNIELKPRNVQIDVIASLEAKLEKYHLPRTKAALKIRLKQVKNSTT